MFEKAIARFDVDVSLSWMIGDRGRDIIPARTLGLKTIQIGDGNVIKGLPIPIFMIFPRLFSCPTLLTTNFKIGEPECFKNFN